MPPPLSPAEQLAYSTVRIETVSASGQIGTGTGFFYRFADTGNKHVPAIVTNRHVVAAAKKGRFRLTLRTADGGPDRLKHLNFEIEDFEQGWTAHPDGTTDLCVMPLAP